MGGFKWLKRHNRSRGNVRTPSWTEAVAAGTEGFVKEVERDMGIRAKARNVVEEKDGHALKELSVSYSNVYAPEMLILGEKTNI